jgi:hypothetical protein
LAAESRKHGVERALRQLSNVRKMICNLISRSIHFKTRQEFALSTDIPLKYKMDGVITRWVIGE